jgi:peptidyl-prolyl cis-trans isomerase SurA
MSKDHNLKFASIQLYDGGLSARDLELRAARTGFAWETTFMPIRLLSVVCLAALVVFPAHSQSLPAPDQKIVAITTYFQFITEDDVDQRTKLNLLLAQKQVGREDVINELVIDMAKIVKAEGAGLLSDALVDKAFADMCSRLGVAPEDLMKTLEEKGIRLDTLRKRLRSDVARERLANAKPDYEDRLDHPLYPKM